jgi:hypothetical protein
MVFFSGIGGASSSYQAEKVVEGVEVVEVIEGVVEV